MTSTHESALESVHSGRIPHQDGYYKIPTSLFVEKVDATMPRLPTVVFYVLNNQAFEILRSPEQTFSFSSLNDHPYIWVSDNEFEHIQKYAESLIKRQFNDTKLSIEDRFRSLKNSAMLVVEDLFEKPTQENIQRSMKVVGSFVYVLMKEPKSYLHLNKLSSHDPYTLRHSVGTAVNCIILGRKLGMVEEQELIDIGMAGLLHDIGKVEVRREVINKAGPLDELEWEEMRGHAQAGYEIVKNDPHLSPRTKRAILEHHEDKHGTGYPQKIKSEDTDLFSRIVSICDVFNALTTDRTYAKARTPFDAFQMMRDKISHKIDDSLFQQLVRIYGGQV